MGKLPKFGAWKQSDRDKSGSQDSYFTQGTRAETLCRNP
jgi:hypothetical protein